MVAAKILGSSGEDMNSALLPLFSSPSSRRNRGKMCENSHTLLGRGADVNTKRASDGNTPLHIAAQLYADDIVYIVLKAGGDEMAVNDHGKTPADIAGPCTMNDHTKAGRICVLLANGARYSPGRGYHCATLSLWRDASYGSLCCVVS